MAPVTSYQRDITFDIMKGIGILLVITCHFFGWNHPFLARFIQSFHMPLFFLVAGYFSKSYDGLRSAKMAVWKFFNRLYWPLFFTQLAIIGWLTALCFFSKEEWNVVVRQILSLFWVDPDGPMTPWGKLGFGVTWFLMALFVSKTVLLLFVSRLRNWAIPVSLFMAIGTLLLHHVFPYSIWCISLGLMALPFVTIGWWLRSHAIPLWLKIAAVISWVLAMAFSELDMYSFLWKCWPFDVLGACGGTYCVYLLSKVLKRCLKMIPQVFAYLGVVSLAIMCVHHFEMTSNMGNHVLALFFDDIPGWVSYVWRYVFTILVAIALTRIPFVKKFFT
jgi:fucose 4-O-acetylase-like acetyltransferase